MASMALPTHFLQSFFVNPRCPSTLIAIEVKDSEVDLGEAAKDSKDLKEDDFVEEQG